MTSVTLSHLYVYPVKGCKPVELARGVITPTGLLFDRNWVVVREANGKFLTQRQKPMLALVNVAVVPATLLDGTTDLAACPDAKLVLQAPGMPELQVPLTTDAAANKKMTSVTVWEWSGQAADEGQAASDWFSKYLGLPCRLVRYAGKAGAEGLPSADAMRRQVDAEWAPIGTETAFADGFPCLLANEASLAELNRNLSAKGEAALPMNRFRPNLVVAGAAPFEEDAWSSLHVGPPSSGADNGVDFENVKPCDRCKVTTINQETAEEGMEPLVTLQETRSGRVLAWDQMVPKFRGAVFFACNLIAKQRGVLRVGDSVIVKATRQGPPQPLSVA